MIENKTELPPIEIKTCNSVNCLNNTNNNNNSNNVNNLNNMNSSQISKNQNNNNKNYFAIPNFSGNNILNQINKSLNTYLNNNHSATRSVNELNISNNDKTVSYVNSYRSYWEKYKELNYLEYEFDDSFTINLDIEYKETFGYYKYKAKLLKNKLLLYTFESFKNNEGDKQPYIILDFDFISATCDLVLETSSITINVLGYNKNFKFRIPGDKLLFEKFVFHLNYFIKQSRGHEEPLFSVCTRDNFFRLFFILEHDFKSKAKTGDLIIFNSYECCASCQRFITCENYDHVALIIRKNDVVYVYESIAKDGCKVRPWNDFIKYHWNLLYSKMVYRELIINKEEVEKNYNLQSKPDDIIDKENKEKKDNCDSNKDNEKNHSIENKENKKDTNIDDNNINDKVDINEDGKNSKTYNDKCIYIDKLDEVHDKILEYVRLTEKKPYRLSCNKLCCYCYPKKYEIENSWNEIKGFYCSQLVAGSLMYSGVLKSKFGAGKYLPGSFSVFKPKNYLLLNKEFDYGPECVIDFSVL